MGRYVEFIGECPNPDCGSLNTEIDQYPEKSREVYYCHDCNLYFDVFIDRGMRLVWSPDTP